MGGATILDELATVTGGLAFDPVKPSDVRTVMVRVAYELRHQYLLSISPMAKLKAGEWRRLQVKAVAPASAPAEYQKLIVRSRDGFGQTK